MYRSRLHSICLLVSLLFIGIVNCLPAAAQQYSYNRMLKITDENDVFKLLGPLSDKGYTNATQFNFYYTKDHKSHFWLYRALPHAGKDAANTYGWGLLQIMYTPQDYTTTQPDAKDWPYAASLTLSHTLHSVNTQKKYLVQTELVAGLMGPSALGRQVQTAIHQMIGSAKPQGWAQQYPTAVLLNVNLTAEKQLAQWRHNADALIGGKAMLGTFMDGGSIYLQGRVGVLHTWFSNYITQSVQPSGKRSLQAYLLLRPALDLLLYDALLDGGVGAGKSEYYKQRQQASINHSISRRLDTGLQLSYGRLGASFTQTILQREINGFPHQRVGSLQLQVAI